MLAVCSALPWHALILLGYSRRTLNLQTHCGRCPRGCASRYALRCEVPQLRAILVWSLACAQRCRTSSRLSFQPLVSGFSLSCVPSRPRNMVHRYNNRLSRCSCSSLRLDKKLLLAPQPRVASCVSPSSVA